MIQPCSRQYSIYNVQPVLLKGQINVNQDGKAMKTKDHLHHVYSNGADTRNSLLDGTDKGTKQIWFPLQLLVTIIIITQINIWNYVKDFLIYVSYRNGTSSMGDYNF